MAEPTSPDMLQMAGHLLESAELLSGAEKRLADATRTLHALDVLAASWEKQAQAGQQEAWHSPRDGYRAEALAACAAELRQTVEQAVREQLIRPHVEATVSVPFPMTEGDWEQFMAVLAAMKPGLVLVPGGEDEPAADVPETDSAEMEG